MAGYFSAIVKSPITGSILITEMTGSFTHLLPIAMISLISYIVADIMNSKPVYEALLERILNKNNSSFEGEYKTKIVIEIPICLGSALEGKKIKEITWPDKCLIVGIRGGKKNLYLKEIQRFIWVTI
jgi:Chloride channel protein EriC